MKKSQLKRLVKTIIQEMAAPPQSPQTDKAKIFQQLDQLAKQMAAQKPGTKEHAQLSDQYIKLWWQARKLLGLKDTVKEIDTENDENDNTCPRCGGTGEVRHPRYGTPSCPSETCKCPECEGSGTISEGY